MKRMILLFLLLSADLAFGQVTNVPAAVAFPQIAVGGDPGGLNFVTLVQVVNNNSSVTTGHVSLFANDGSALPALFDEQGPQATMDIRLEAGEARQLQLTSSGALTSGWMEIDYSPSDAQTTVILQSRSGPRLLSEVGVDPVTSTIASSDFAAETDTAINTGIAIANPSSATQYVLARLWDPSAGTVLASTILTLPPNGHNAQYLTDLFSNVLTISPIRAEVSLDACATSLCSSAGGSFIATVLRQNIDQFTTIPVDGRPGPTDTISQFRYLPQVAFGGSSDALNMKTVLYFTTNVSTGVFGTVEIFDDDGNPIAASVDGGPPASSFTFTVSSHRVSRVVLSGDATLRSGWIRVTNQSGNVHLIVNAVFQTFIGSTLSAEAGVRDSPAVTPQSPSPPITRGLIYVRIQAGLANVGVAFDNPQSTSNTITLVLFNRVGDFALTRDITLPPFGHQARYVTELFPELGSTDFDGALFMRSSTAFSALALRLADDPSGTKLATLPVAVDGMFRPSINTIRVTSTVRSTATVNFSIDVTDYDSDLATASSTSISAVAITDFGSGISDFGVVTMNGTGLVGRQSGTITGTFQARVTGIPSNFTATFEIWLYDSVGNFSNIVTVPAKFN
jgi:hypothetical protein